MWVKKMSISNHFPVKQKIIDICVQGLIDDIHSSERCFVYKHLTIIILIFTYFDLRKGEHSALFCFPSLSMTLKCSI